MLLKLTCERFSSFSIGNDQQIPILVLDMPMLANQICWSYEPFSIEILIISQSDIQPYFLWKNTYPTDHYMGHWLHPSNVDKLALE